MNIVFVSRELRPSRRCGGIGSYIADVSVRLAERGHRVSVLCASDDTRINARTTIRGIDVIRLAGGDFCIPGVESDGFFTPLVSHIRSIVRFRSYRQRVAQELNQLVNSGAADIVVFAEYGAEAWEWARLPRRIPMVIRCDGPTGLDRSRGQRIPLTPLRSWAYWVALREYDIIRRADAVYTPSSAMANFVAAETGIRPEEISVIPYLIECDFWEGTLPSQPQSNRGPRKEVFFAGTLNPAKGILELLQAVQSLRLAGEDVRLVLAGRMSRWGRQQVSRFSRQYGPEWLIALGDLPREMLREKYRQADVVCLPSWWEPFGLTCVEAMSSGALVIGTCIGGMGEIIRDGVTGFLVPPRQPHTLAETIRRALHLPLQRQAEIRTAAQTSARDRFDVKVIIPLLEQFLLSVRKEFNRKGIRNTC